MVGEQHVSQFLDSGGWGWIHKYGKQLVSFFNRQRELLVVLRRRGEQFGREIVTASVDQQVREFGNQRAPHRDVGERDHSRNVQRRRADALAGFRLDERGSGDCLPGALLGICASASTGVSAAQPAMCVTQIA